MTENWLMIHVKMVKIIPNIFALHEKIRFQGGVRKGNAYKEMICTF